eukprot:2299662-Amphidinium_carterae.1
MQDEDKQEQAKLAKEREDTRRNSGVQWAALDVDTLAFEQGEASANDGKDVWCLNSRTPKDTMEQRTRC